MGAKTWLHLASALLCLLVAVPGPASAQVPSQEQLRDLLERQRETQGRPVEAPSPVDAARERAEQRRQRALTTIERERPQPLSQIERDYNMRLGLDIEAYEKARLEREQPKEGDVAPPTESEILRQFGYGIFRDVERPTTVTGRIPDAYVLGVGDELVVSLIGSTNRVLTTSVDSEGRVVVPELPPIPAAGRTFGAFRQALEQAVSQTLLGTEAFVSIANLRQITVSVLGEVVNPGVYQVTSLTDVIQVLALAGGVEKTGSLRRIAVIGDGERRQIDLYRLMAGESDIDLRIRDGDRVVVPLIGDLAAVAGLVVRPAIYELSSGDTATAQTILEMAGGALRPRGIVIQRNRIDAVGRQSIEVVAPDSDVAAGDLLFVFPSRQLQVGRVEIDGHVRQPGFRSLKAAPTVSALLDGGEALEPSPYLPFAVLETTDDATLKRLYRPINLAPILAGAEDIALKDQDTLLVFGPEEIDYLSSTSVRGAVLAPGSVGTNACPAVRELARRARQADAERLAAAARSVFVAEAIEGATDAQEAEQGTSEEVVTARQLALEAAAREECSDFFEARPALLALAIEYGTVSIGAVREPGLYPIAGTATIRDLVAVSSGLSLTADPSRVEISTFRGDGAPGDKSEFRRYVDLRQTSMAQITVPTGSAVRFYARESQLETGTVLLSGEFVHPGVYTIRKGELLSQVIERAGGLTEQAYPYGAVFTRVRVKQQEQEGFRRTARELNNALALALLKEDVGGEAVVAAQGLVRAVASVEAVGRVVVEADPTVLRLNPERDIVLESGDSIVMPKRPNFVLTAGDLLNPGALQFSPGKRLEDYLDEAGGFQETADENRVFVVFPNGVARPITLSMWSRSSVQIPPGSTIVVPKDINPLETLNIVREITGVLSSLAISAASIAVIADRN